MTAAELRAELSVGYTDYEFLYKDKRGSICPFNELDGTFHAVISYAGQQAEFNSLDDVMNVPFFDSKSLNEVAEEIELYG